MKFFSDVEQIIELKEQHWEFREFGYKTELGDYVSISKESVLLTPMKVTIPKFRFKRRYD